MKKAGQIAISLGSDCPHRLPGLYWGTGLAPCLARHDPGETPLVICRFLICDAAYAFASSSLGDTAFGCQTRDFISESFFVDPCEVRAECHPPESRRGGRLSGSGTKGEDLRSFGHRGLPVGTNPGHVYRRFYIRVLSFFSTPIVLRQIPTEGARLWQ